MNVKSVRSKKAVLIIHIYAIHFSKIFFCSMYRVSETVFRPKTGLESLVLRPDPNMKLVLTPLSASRFSRLQPSL